MLDALRSLDTSVPTSARNPHSTKRATPISTTARILRRPAWISTTLCAPELLLNRRQRLARLARMAQDIRPFARVPLVPVQQASGGKATTSQDDAKRRTSGLPHTTKRYIMISRRLDSQGFSSKSKTVEGIGGPNAQVKAVYTPSPRESA
jgi:hypothetical protein